MKRKKPTRKTKDKIDRFHTALAMRALELLVDEGTPLQDAFDILNRSLVKNKTGDAFTRCQDGIKEGKSLAVALHDAGFPLLFATMAAAGEETGKTGLALKLISDELERQILEKPGKDLGGQATIMTHVLAMTQSLGIPLVHGIRITADVLDHAGLKKALLKAGDDVAAGSSFADALEKHPEVMGTFYTNYIRAGEKSGRLDIALKKLAMFMDSLLKMQEKSAG